jgi:tetratricopeptide (TPR) repeat protein
VKRQGTFVSFAFAGLCALALPACSGTMQSNLTQAEREFASHDYPAARSHLLALLHSRPNDRTARLLLAKTLVALGDGEGASTALRSLANPAAAAGEVAELSAEAALLRRRPDEVLTTLNGSSTAEAGRLRGLAALQKGDVAAAVDDFERGLAAGGNARLFADYSRLHMMSGRMSEAMAMASSANRIAPEGIDTLLIEGELARRRGDRVRALHLFTLGARLYPTSVAALVGKAEVMHDLGRADDLRPIMSRLAIAAPNDTRVIALQADAAAAKGDWAQVRDIVQRVESKLSNTDPTRALYGEAFLRLGQANLALAQIAPVARAFPHNREVTRLQGEAMLASGDARSAMVTLKPLADRSAASAAELALMVQAARATHDPSLSRYETLLKRQPVKALVGAFAQGDAAVRTRNWAAAAMVYGRILAATDGRNVVALNNLAYSQLMLGRADRALVFANRAFIVAPNNPSVLDTMGWVTFKHGGDVGRAKRLLARALLIAPTNKAIRAHVAEVDKAPA